MTHASKTVLILASVLVAVAIFNLAIVSETYSGISSKKEKASLESAEAQRPANISLITIGSQNCADCFDINKVVSAVKSASVKVTGERALDYKSDEARTLIQKYGIKKSPALIISGEIDKPNAAGALSQIGSAVDGAIVYSNPPPIYVNISTGNEIGRVSATIISADSCAQCRNVSQIEAFFKSKGVIFQSVNIYDYKSVDGKQLLSKYNITRVPAILFSKDLGSYGGSIAEVSGWSGGIGTIESDGAYVVRTAFPPYVDVSTNKAMGLVSLKNIVDGSCANCYNVSLHKSELLNFGIIPINEAAYDVSSPEGKALLARYNITRVPTIIISPDAAIYPQLASIWSSVGIIGTDGSYIFTAVDRMGAYKDLAANKTITPVKSSAQ